MIKELILLNTLTFLPVILHGQSGHYWTQQYGAKSVLLSSSVIGGVEDLGAVYYNPARLGFIKNPAFLVSADIYELSKFKIEDITDPDADLSKSNFSPIPSLVAGSFRLKSLPGHQFAYAFLSRQTSELSFNYRDEIVGDVISGIPGSEIFEANFDFSTFNNTDWVGGSWAYAVNNNLSFGLSAFLSILDRTKELEIRLQALSDNQRVSIYSFGRDYSHNSYGLVWKLAAAYKWNNIDLGLTFTTPTLKLSGEGDYNYRLYFSDTQGFAPGENTYGNSYQSGFSVSNKTPFSIGAGCIIPIKKNKLYISAEYYGSVPQYTIFRADDFVLQSDPDTTISFRLLDKQRDVLNAGIGFEWYLNEKISGYGSFSTDFSSAVSGIPGFAENEPEAFNSTLRSDFYHFGGGILLDLRGVDLTFGLTYIGAKESFPRPASFPEGEDDDIIFDTEDTGSIKWQRWRFIFSFSVPFLSQIIELE